MTRTWREIGVGMKVRGSDGRTYGRVVHLGPDTIVARKGWLIPKLFHVLWDEIATVENGVVTVTQPRPLLN